MPELPEVEYTRRQLQRAMAGAHIRGVLLRRQTLRYPLPADFGRRLAGQRVRAVARRAKYLLVELGSGDVLLMHLGMSGSFRVLPAQRTRPRRRHHDDGPFELHDHVVFEMSTGAAIVFNDPRRFGSMTLLTSAERETHRALRALGPEPLGRGFDAAALARALDRRRIALKIALADQRLMAGLGNIYASEALHRAGLSPSRRASTLVARSGAPRPAVERLVVAVRDVLREAIGNQYRTGGEDPFLVYGREGEACPRRGCGGRIRRIVQGGRSTFYCPRCQR